VASIDVERPPRRNIGRNRVEPAKAALERQQTSMASRVIRISASAPAPSESTAVLPGGCARCGGAFGSNDDDDRGDPNPSEAVETGGEARIRAMLLFLLASDRPLVADHNTKRRDGDARVFSDVIRR
jgi:hypothetical protein